MFTESKYAGETADAASKENIYSIFYTYSSISNNMSMFSKMIL